VTNGAGISGKGSLVIGGFRVSHTLKALSPDGSKLAIAAGSVSYLNPTNNRISVFNASTGAELASWRSETLQTEWSRLGFSPDGSRLLAVDAADDPTLIAFSLASGIALTGNKSLTGAVVADAVILDDATVLYSTELSSYRWTIGGAESELAGLAKAVFSPDGSFAAALSTGTTLKIAELGGATVEWPLQASYDKVYGFSRDKGSVFLCDVDEGGWGASGKSASIDRATGAPAGSLESISIQKKGYCRDFFVSNDGNSNGNSCLIYHAPTLSSLGSVSLGNGGYVCDSMVFSVEGGAFAIEDGDGSIVIFQQN
jgi:hypothetical protein